MHIHRLRTLHKLLTTVNRGMFVDNTVTELSWRCTEDEIALKGPLSFSSKYIDHRYCTTYVPYNPLNTNTV